MRNTIFAGLALTVLAALPAKAAPAPALLLEAPSASTLAALAQESQGNVEVWMDGRRDLYRPGERMRVNVRSDHDGYLAVFHIDTNGDVDVIYPRSQADDGWVDAGRTLRLGSRGGYDYLRSRGGYGMGYVMAVTLDEPMELHRVHSMYGVRTADWDGNRSIFGDPFYAMDELVRAIVPEDAYGYESVDYTTYHVGQRYRHPRYACYNGYGDWYYQRGAYWDDCDRVRILLVRYPYYYDAHRWRGSRRVYYDDYYRRVPARNRPLHGYKERTDGYAPSARTASRRPSPAERPGGSGTGTADRPRSGGSADRPLGGGGTSTDNPRGEGAVSRRPERGAGVPGSARSNPGRTGEASAGRSAPGTRPTRPTRGTRQDQQDGAQPPQQDRPVQPSRERPTFQRRPPSESPPSRQAEPRREEPRRESPPSRSAEPRRESPPSRSAEPRRESPPPRSAEPRRESPPSRSSGSSAGSSSRSSGSSSSSSSRGSSSGSSGGSRSSAPGRRP